MLKLRELPTADRPREKLIRTGAGRLSDVELLSMLLGSGNRNQDVFSVAKALITVIDSSWPHISAQPLTKIPGIGAAKAALIVAALEFARRRIRPQGVKIRSAADAFPLLQHLADRPQEHFLTISLNGANEVIATRVVTIGLVNVTQVHPREVFSDPICDRACAIIIAHNHPSGNLSPSDEDLRVTDSLKKAGRLLGIRLLDHLIFSPQGYYSLGENGVDFS